MLSGMMRRAYEFGKLDELGRARRFFVENSSELGFGDDFLEDGEFCPVEIIPALCLGYGGDIERPNANFCDLEWVEDVHRDGICTLIIEVASDSAAQSFVCLANVDAHFGL